MIAQQPRTGGAVHLRSGRIGRREAVDRALVHRLGRLRAFGSGFVLGYPPKQSFFGASHGGVEVRGLLVRLLPRALAGGQRRV